MNLAGGGARTCWDRSVVRAGGVRGSMSALGVSGVGLRAGVGQWLYPAA